ncbi:multicomponent Na+:H+ antiporter subunit E [Halanaerobium saccharolyticum]|uniref:Multicomponent Na+:H+ antiporter subunit E n=1 Tax=Halanaerobium saccharolyticum TaxID=43595 RepID=A0A4R6LM53_9FIRM|nr:Na+/H+ antiporter subunit E [Halanaerobium saccharolyticum]TDO84620.1 multicomponent Na+:H+ antiporter subunit E [Halanaerobium saccharolyticum]
MQKLKRYFFTTAVYFLFWLAYTSSLVRSEMMAGLIISLILSYFTYQSFSREKGNNNILSRFLAFFKYLPVFLWEMIKANFDVARRVIDPSLPINPGIIEIKTKLKSDQAKLFLANSITLTPGTLTVDIIDDSLYIHWIDVKTEDPGEQKKIISEKFERLLEGVF